MMRPNVGSNKISNNQHGIAMPLFEYWIFRVGYWIFFKLGLQSFPHNSRNLFLSQINRVVFIPAVSDNLIYVFFTHAINA